MKKIEVFGADWCGFCHSVMYWLDKNNHLYTYRNVDVEGRDAMHQAMPHNETIPVVVINGSAYVNPSYKQLSDLLNEDQ